MPPIAGRFEACVPRSQGEGVGVVTPEKTRTERLTISGEDLVSTVKKLVHQGNIRRIAIENKDGKTLLEIPLTLGVVGALLLPTLAALGALAAIVTECRIVVERIDDDSAS
jgi:CBS domain-containing protein